VRCVADPWWLRCLGCCARDAKIETKRTSGVGEDDRSVCRLGQWSPRGGRGVFRSRDVKRASGSLCKWCVAFASMMMLLHLFITVCRDAGMTRTIGRQEWNMCAGSSVIATRRQIPLRLVRVILNMAASQCHCCCQFDKNCCFSRRHGLLAYTNLKECRLIEHKFACPRYLRLVKHTVRSRASVGTLFCETSCRLWLTVE